MPVIKNILRKAKNSFQGLKNVDVFIEDTDPNSKYFNIFDLPEELPLGCSSFLIEGSELLKKEVNLKIELLDSQNNVVFTTPVDNYLEDKSRRVSIEIYEDAAAGVATLTILGELDPNKTSVPQGFRDVYNVRFNKRININKTKENDRPIRFYGPPTISVSEIVKGVIEETTGGTNQTSTITGTIGLNVTTNEVFDSEVNPELPTNNVDDLGEDDYIKSESPKSKKTATFNSKIGKKGKKKKKQKKFKTTYSITGNVVAMGAGTNNSSNKITSDFVGATITISNPHQLVDTDKFPTTRYTLPTSYSTTISEVVNETTFKVKTPYYIIDDTTKRIPVSLKSATNNVSITYDSYVEEAQSSIFKRSYADITVGNLRTFSGDVYKAKILTRDSNTPTDFEKIYDAYVEPPNILIDETSATGFTNIGFFHQQSDINNNWVSSSIGNSTGAFATQNNQYLVDGLLLSGSNETFGNLVEFRTKNSFDLEKDVDYIVKFDSYFFKETAEYKSDQDTISTEKRADLKVFLSGSGLTGNEGEEDYYLGRVEIPTNSNDEGEISSVVGSFRSAGSGLPKAWLKFKLNSGQFIIKDVSIEPFSEENFNPNYFRTIVPMPGLVNVKRNRLFDFRAEFYDVNNNEADVGATIERVNFDGVPTIIQGTDGNKLSGSLLVGESIEMYGTNPAYLRSVGYQGFAHTTANNKGGFMLFSGSIGSGAAGGNRITASEAYDGVGLEIVDAHDSDNHRFLKFRTNPSEFTVQTDQFFLGKDGQFISGSNGNIVISSSNFFLGGESTFVSGSNDKLEISSSNFHLDNDGSVIMQGTITATAGGQIGGFTIGSASMFSGADEVDTTFFLSGSGHTGTNFVNSNLVISSSGFQVNSTGEISASAGNISGFTITGGSGATGAADAIHSADKSLILSGSGQITGSTVLFTGGKIGSFNIGKTTNATPLGVLFSDSNELVITGSTGQITGSQVLFTGGKIGGFTIDADEIKSTNLLLDSANEKITVGSANAVTIQGGGTDNFITMGKTTFGQSSTVGAILGMDATVPTLELFKDANNQFIFNGSGIDIKTETFKLDTDRLDIDSSTSRISVFDDAGSPKEVVRIGEVDGASNFGMKIFDGTGTADGDILVEFSETTNNIAGWVIGTSTIQGGNLVLNKEGTIESADFSSGNIAGSGKGFRLSALDNGFLEVENARIRGTLSTAVFEKETVNAVGGQLLIGNSTTITGSGGFSGVTSSAATMSVENVSGFTGSYNGFNTAGAVSDIDSVDGEILILKKVDNTGFSTEYVCVQSASFNDPDNTDTNPSGLLYVTRSFGLGTGTLGAGPGSNFTGSVGEGAKNYEDGQVIVSTGRYISGTGASTVGTGYINLNARPTDAATPYIDIVERTGSKVYEMDLKARLGDLSGLSTAKVGSTPGFGLFTDNAFLTNQVTVGTLATEHITVDGTSILFKDSTTTMAELRGTTFTLGGAHGTTKDNVVLDGSSVSIYGNDANTGVFVTDNAIDIKGDANNDKVTINNNGLTITSDGTAVGSFIGNTITLGNTSNEHVLMDNTGVNIKQGSKLSARYAATSKVFDRENNNTFVEVGGDGIIFVSGSITGSEFGHTGTKFTASFFGAADKEERVEITEDGMEIYKGDATKAIFGSDTTLTGGTLTIQGTTGTIGDDKIVVGGGSLAMFANASKLIDIVDGKINIGPAAVGGTAVTGNVRVEAGNVYLYGDNTNTFAQMSSAGLELTDDGTKRAVFAGTTTIGNTSTEHIKITATKFELKRGSEVFVSASSAGLFTSGSINASSGEIAGYSITDGTIEKKDGDAGVTIDGNNSRIIVSGSDITTGNSVRLFGDSGVIEVSQSGVGVFDTGRTKTFTTTTFVEPQIFKPGGGKLSFISSSTTTTSPAPTMENLDVTSNAEVGGMLKTDKLSIDSNDRSTPFSFVNSILRNTAATNTDGAVHPTASFAVVASTNYADNDTESNCHPAFLFSADYFTELTADDNKTGWVQNGSPTSGSNVFTIQTTVDEADNDDFADAKFNVLGLETNTSGVKNDIQNEYTFLQAKHSGSIRAQLQHDGDFISAGNITAFGTSFLTVSDKREKKDIYQISESLDKVLELRPTKFTWRETNKQDVGFIAQEVEQVIPEVIEISRGFINTGDDKERKTIAYPKLVPYLVDTIQQLTKRIEELEKKVK